MGLLSIFDHAGIEDLAPIMSLPIPLEAFSTPRSSVIVAPSAPSHVCPTPKPGYGVSVPFCPDLSFTE